MARKILQAICNLALDNLIIPQTINDSQLVLTIILPVTDHIPEDEPVILFTIHANLVDKQDIRLTHCNRLKDKSKVHRVNADMLRVDSSIAWNVSIALQDILDKTC